MRLVITHSKPRGRKQKRRKKKRHNHCEHLQPHTCTRFRVLLLSASECQLHVTTCTNCTLICYTTQTQAMLGGVICELIASFFLYCTRPTTERKRFSTGSKSTDNRGAASNSLETAVLGATTRRSLGGAASRIILQKPRSRPTKPNSPLILTDKYLGLGRNSAFLRVSFACSSVMRLGIWLVSSVCRTGRQPQSY